MHISYLKRKKKAIVYLLLSSIIIVGLLYVNIRGKNYIYKAVWYNFADIDDYKIFYQSTILPSDKSEKWKISKRYNKTALNEKLSPIHKKLSTVAFLVIVGDSILEERYWQGFDTTTISNSFSMAKSIVSLLIGIALDKGFIESVDQKVGDFIEDFKVGEKNKITIRHLLTMSSGLNWSESYSSPFSITTEAYYGDDLYKTVSKLKVIEEPGKYYRYKSGDTEILAMVLEKATGMRTSNFASRFLWTKIGAEKPAFWSLDTKDGMEKAYCCFYATARDFARIGKLILNNGAWNNDTVVSLSYLRNALKPNKLINFKTGNQVDFYGWQFWIIPNYKEKGDIFYCRGILGQYIICIPYANAVIVRLGKKRGEKIGEAEHFAETFHFIDAVLEVI
jgi:CubicO group peptidase (beta-lactamase class C family)